LAFGGGSWVKELQWDEVQWVSREKLIWLELCKHGAKLLATLIAGKIYALYIICVVNFTLETWAAAFYWTSLSLLQKHVQDVKANRPIASNVLDFDGHVGDCSMAMTT